MLFSYFWIWNISYDIIPKLFQLKRSVNCCVKCISSFLNALVYISQYVPSDWVSKCSKILFFKLQLNKSDINTYRNIQLWHWDTLVQIDLGNCYNINLAQNVKRQSSGKAWKRNFSRLYEASEREASFQYCMLFTGKVKQTYPSRCVEQNLYENFDQIFISRRL